MSKILLAEDERGLREITSLALIKNGYEVDAVDNGIDTCTLIGNNRYDLIILDIMMPGKDGKEVCRFIRSKYDVPVVFLTALGEENDIIEGYEIGADEYVTKPFSTKVLLAKISVLISRYKGMLVKDGKIEVGNIIIEPARRYVAVSGKAAALAPKEYELLLYFLDNRGIVLTRDQILDAVWGKDYDGYDRAVDTHVKKLRAALGQEGSHIETVIKAGYKWM